MKNKSLTKVKRSQFSLSDQLKSILVGLNLGDLHIQKQNVNARLRFEQGIVHEDYLNHLYDLFKSYCPQAPKIYTRSPDKITGKVHSRICFSTYSLPCFNEMHELFYTCGAKIIPSNIEDLLTPLGLCYWICDDGGFNKISGVVVISTHGFSFGEVELLTRVLNNKFKLISTINKNGNHFVIRISHGSLPVLQKMLAPHMPSMMKYKIGL